MVQCVRRRDFLRSTTVGVVGLSGCTMFESQSESQMPELVDFTAFNYHDTPHTVHVRLELDGETVYRESKQIAAGGSDDAQAAVFSDYPTVAEPYVLSAWRDDRPETGAMTIDFASFDTECLGVMVNIGTYGRDVENPRLSIFYTSNCASGT